MPKTSDNFPLFGGYNNTADAVHFQENEMKYYGTIYQVSCDDTIHYIVLLLFFISVCAEGEETWGPVLNAFQNFCLFSGIFHGNKKMGPVIGAEKYRGVCTHTKRQLENLTSSANTCGLGSTAKEKYLSKF